MIMVAFGDILDILNMSNMSGACPHIYPYLDFKTAAPYEFTQYGIIGNFVGL
jgi:hypothetical protein